MAAILGLHHTSSRISITSIASFSANNTDAEAAYRQFCNDLYQIGVTEDTFSQKEDEILDALKSQEMMVAGNQISGKGIRNHSQLPGAGCSSATFVQLLISQ